MPTATGPKGEKLVLQDGKWVPMQGAAAPRALPMMPTAEAADEDRAIREGLRTAAGSFTSNMLSLPHAAGELLAAGAAIPKTAGGAAVAAMRGQPMNIMDRFSTARSEQEGKFPASLLLKFPDPDSGDVLAVPGAFARLPEHIGDDAFRDPNAPIVAGSGLRRAYGESRAAEQERAEENPIANAAGRTAGDVASMLLLRPGARAADALKLERTNPRATIQRLAPPPGADRIELKDRLDYAAKVLGRGLGRSAEAGFDGAVLAAVGDGDPVQTAAYTAGIQAGSSMAIGAKNSIMRNPIKSIVGITVGHEIWKTVAPGPQDIFGSKDAAFQEVVGAYAVGTLAGLMGGSRGGVGAGKLRELTSVLNDSARYSAQSVVTQLNEARRRGDPKYEAVIGKLSTEPDYFGRETRIRLERASRSQKPNALLNEIDALMRSTRFRQKFDAIGVANAKPATRYRTGGSF